MTVRSPLFALSLIAATALAGCGRSESVETFKPDRAEEKVAVTDTKAAPKTADAGTATAAGAGAFAPQDSCAGDESFAAYRTRLDAAIKAKDIAALTPLLDPAIKLDFGGGSGVEEFGKRLAGNGTDAPLWPELATVMALGCSLDRDGKAASSPWYFDNLGARDAFTTFIPARSGIELVKAVPEGDAKPEVVRTLGWDALAHVNPEEGIDRPWIEVKLDDGTTGFVRTEDVRSAIDYRAIFNKGDDGAWKMTAFIAGD